MTQTLPMLKRKQSDRRNGKKLEKPEVSKMAKVEPMNQQKIHIKRLLYGHTHTHTLIQAE